VEDTSTATSLISNIIAFFICLSPFVFVLGGIGLFVFMIRRNKNKVSYAPSTLSVSAAGVGTMSMPVAVADSEATMVSATVRKPLNNATSFAPSEVVLFNGEKFAKKTMAGNVTLLHLDQNVSAAQLGQAALAAAFLANEQAGAVRLEVRQTKALFGLITNNTLFVEPVAAPSYWPANSIESRIYPLAEQLRAQNGKNDVANMVYELLGEDSDDPWKEVIELIKAGLAERSLLDRIKEKKLKIFTVWRYTLPDATKALASQQDVDPVQQVLLNCERSQPQLWQALTDANKRAVSRRTSRDRSSSGDFDADFD
jgi:hypothetical protein